MSIQTEKDRIDAEATIKKEEIDKQVIIDRQTVADLEASRIRQEAEQIAQQIQNEAQN